MHSATTVTPQASPARKHYAAIMVLFTKARYKSCGSCHRFTATQSEKLQSDPSENLSHFHLYRLWMLSRLLTTVQVLIFQVVPVAANKWLTPDVLGRYQRCRAPQLEAASLSVKPRIQGPHGSPFQISLLTTAFTAVCTLSHRVSLPSHLFQLCSRSCSPKLSSVR